MASVDARLTILSPWPMNTLKRHSIVATNPDAYEWKWRLDNPDRVADFPVRFGDRVIYLGEISDDSAHCAVATLDGTVVWILHPEEFVPVQSDEVTPAERRALEAWLDRVPGVAGAFAPLTIIRRRDGAVDWENSGRRGDTMLLYLGEGYPENGRFAAATWADGLLIRDDIAAFEEVPQDDR